MSSMPATPPALGVHDQHNATWWTSLTAFYAPNNLWEQGAAGSNPATPTILLLAEGVEGHDRLAAYLADVHDIQLHRVAVGEPVQRRCQHVLHHDPVLGGSLAEEHLLGKPAGEGGVSPEGAEPEIQELQLGGSGESPLA